MAAEIIKDAAQHQVRTTMMNAETASRPAALAVASSLAYAGRTAPWPTSSSG
jgi:hypothetical protein